MIKRIHMNKHNIVHNKNHEDKKPVITVKTYKDNHYCNNVNIDGPSRLVYNPNNPLSCGAVAWIETKAKVTTDTGIIIE